MEKYNSTPIRDYIAVANFAGERDFDITSGSLVLSLDELGEVEIPKLYGGEITA